MSPRLTGATCSRITLPCAFGWFSQVAAEGVHAPQQPLAVVEPVDADELVAAAQHAPHARELAAAGRGEGVTMELVHVDADREGAGAQLAPEGATTSPRTVPPQARRTCSWKRSRSSSVWKPMRS